LDRIIINAPLTGMAVAKQAGAIFYPDNHVVCRVKDTTLLGGVVYYNINEESCAIHIAAWDEHWINRDMLWAAFDFPFNVLNVNRIFGEINEDNWHALNFNEKFGFRTVARVEGVYPGNRACIVRRLDREDCRFLSIQPRHTKRVVH
jgi:RimJ/RimL family protein N-acetyltransferase